MNEKDLMRGMSHVDDELIEEASKKSPVKGFHLSNVLAAGMALVVGVGAVTGGGTIVSQRKQLAELQARVAELEHVDAPQIAGNEGAGEAIEVAGKEAAVGQASAAKMGTGYRAAKDYGEVYDRVYALRREMEMVYGNGVEGAVSAAGGWEEEAVADEAVPSPAEVPADYDSGQEAPAADKSEDMAGGGSFSNTNVMTRGVDESDIVKTDGSFIYMVQSGSVQIADIRKGGAPSQMKNLTIPFQAPSDSIREMYVDDQYLTVITSHAAKKDEEYASMKSRPYWDSQYENEVWVYVYDLTDPMEPVLVDSMSQDGTYKTSRKVDDLVYLFTTERLACPDYEKAEACQEDKLAEWIPSINNVPIDAGCIYLPQQGYNELVISSFSTADPKQVIDAKVIVDDYSEVYVGSCGIYLYHQEYNGMTSITEITQMSYKDGMLAAGKSNTVLGAIQDKFAINEKNGYLRVLTTDWSGPSEVNTLFVLDSDLKQVGRIDEIARGESIYAARFLGDMAYFITYHNSDPLFVADLRDPANPKLLGNVEISGFSDYLHVWDATHILGIGYETDENSNRQGMKLVMFDVRDPSNPVIENTTVLADDSVWCYSSAVDQEYKAILADPVKNLIGFGYYYEVLDGDDRWDSNTVYSVLSYDKEKGFHEEMRTALDLDTVEGYRGLYVNDWFYIAGNAKIRTFDMKNFEEQ